MFLIDGAAPSFHNVITIPVVSIGFESWTCLLVAVVQTIKTSLGAAAARLFGQMIIAT
jgi:hypothetical protein